MILKISIRVKQPFGSVYTYILYVCVADVRVTGLMPALRSGSLFAPGRIAGDRIQRLQISGDHATE